LYQMTKDMAVVRVHILDIENSSDSDKVDVSGLKKSLEDVFANRKSINFEVVGSKSDADLLISCDVQKFIWKEDDPLDFLVGTAYDLLTSENYAYLEAHFDVFNAKKGRRLWSRKLKVDYTKANMPVDESIPLINEKTAKIFMRDCFSKGRSKR
ncbi:hypothetical protein ACFL0T_07420, partial [Candidatus Omnitrophota bacterium]